MNCSADGVKENNDSETSTTMEFPEASLNEKL